MGDLSHSSGRTDPHWRPGGGTRGKHRYNSLRSAWMGVGMSQNHITPVDILKMALGVVFFLRMSIMPPHEIGPSSVFILHSALGRCNSNR